MMSWLRTLANRDDQEGAPGRYGFLLGSLVVLLVALPIGQMLSGSTPSFPILLALVLMASVLVNSHQRWIFVVATLAGLGAIAGIIGAEFHDAVWIRIVTDLLSLGLLGSTTLVLLSTLVHANEVSQDTIVGGICVYLLVGLFFAVTFMLMTELYPGAFIADGETIVRSATDSNTSATKLLYFSFVTLTTLGYGDITPGGDMGRMLSVAEALIGQLYLTIFVARLVALYVGHARKS